MKAATINLSFRNIVQQHMDQLAFTFIADYVEQLQVAEFQTGFQDFLRVRQHGSLSKETASITENLSNSPKSENKKLRNLKVPFLTHTYKKCNYYLPPVTTDVFLLASREVSESSTRNELYRRPLLRTKCVDQLVHTTKRCCSPIAWDPRMAVVGHIARVWCI